MQRAERTVPTYSLGQWSISSLGTPNLDLGRARVRIAPDSITWEPCSVGAGHNPGTGWFLAYSSKIDQVSGDAEFEYGMVNWTDYEAACGYNPGDCWGW